MNISNLAQSEPPLRQQLEPRLRESDAVHSTLEPRKAFFLAGLILDSTKEVLESFANPIRNILGNLGMKFRRMPLNYGVIVKLRQRHLAKFVSIYAQGKKFIVDCLTGLKRINQSDLLLNRRIHPIFEHLLNNHKQREYQPIYKTFGNEENNGWQFIP
jgi:hypothetical protein